MRKMLAGLLALMLLAHGCIVLAAELPLAAQVDAYKSFERYQSYKLEENGEWSAHDLMATQLLRTISSGAGKAYMGTGLCVLYPGVRGNVQLGLTEVVLKVCLLKTEALGADSLSILSGGKRYDFVASSKKESFGSYACETFELTMDAQGLAMLEQIVESGCSVSIYGGTKMYRTTINETSTDQNAKQKLEAVAIGSLRSLLAELEQVGLHGYALWDLNAGQWSLSRPQMSTIMLSSEPYSEDLPKLDESFQCLAIADKMAVSKIQQLLKDNAFYAGKVDGKYGVDTRTAIREAQRYYGLLQTGQADRTLVGLLSGTESISESMGEAPQAQLIAPDQPLNAEAGVRYRCEGIAEARLDRRWFAGKLLPTHVALSSNAQATKATAQTSSAATPTPAPTSSPADKTAIVPQNASNLLLIIDGKLTNLSAESLFLPMSVQAELTIAGQYTYPCTVRCEQAQGKAFGTELLPLESSRVLVFAEVPESITDNYTIALTLKITTPNGTLELNY